MKPGTWKKHACAGGYWFNVARESGETFKGSDGKEYPQWDHFLSVTSLRANEADKLVEFLNDREDQLQRITATCEMLIAKGDLDAFNVLTGNGAHVPPEARVDLAARVEDLKGEIHDLIGENAEIEAQRQRFESIARRQWRVIADLERRAQRGTFGLVRSTLEQLTGVKL